MNSSTPSPDEIFERASQLSGEARAAYLNEATGDDEPFRQRIEALLQANEGAGTAFLNEPAVAPAKSFVITTDMIPVIEKTGDKIGRYKLREQIGEGGCGVVYVADQEEPVRRRVALKVIKLGMDTRQVIARFEAERQALALMDHPNIAKVLDAGATETGRLYFVMELVRGIKITDYCDKNNLSTDERLKLFIQVCSAIQHAHQKGIIHRDIKPSNILVTSHDGVPVPKVIDFGIAKATSDQRLTDKTIYTAFDQFIGTPAYMSPEQAEMSGLDIDTRSDIYSLGVLLYELLAGSPPFDPQQLIKVGFDTMRKTIREVEPPSPSTRLSTLAHGDLNTVAQHHRAEASKLLSSLRGDLDWIVMKALEKDRVRRYENVAGFAQDVQRYLSNEAVTARPPGGFYRFRKLVRRNKLLFAAISAVAAALLIGMVISTWLFFREMEARSQAGLRQLLAESQLVQITGRHDGWSQSAWSLATNAAKLQAAATSADVRDQAVAVLAGLDAHKATTLTNLPDIFPSNTVGAVAAVSSNADLVACSTDGTLVVKAESEGKVTVRSVRDGRFLATFPIGRSEVGGLALKQVSRVLELNQGITNSMNGDWLLAVGDSGGSINIWDVRTQTLKSYCRGGQFDVLAVAFNSDGTILASGGIGPVKLWDVATGHEILELGTGYDIQSLRFSTNDKYLSVKRDDPEPSKRAQVWELEYGRGIQTLRGLSAPISKICFSADGKKLAALSHHWEVGVWDLSSGHLSHVIEAPRGILADNAALAFSPSGDRLAFSAGNRARMWDLQSGLELDSWDLPAGLLDVMAFTDQGQLFLFRMEDHVCQMRELLPSAKMKLIAENADLNGRVLNAAAPSDGRYVVVEGIHTNDTGQGILIEAFDSITGKELWSIPSLRTNGSGCLTIDGGGKTVAFLTNSSTPAVLAEMASGVIMKQLPWSPCAIHDKTRVFAVQGHQPIHERGCSLFFDGAETPDVTLGIDQPGVQLATFDFTGNLLAWGNTDGTVTVCDLKEINERLKQANLQW